MCVVLVTDVYCTGHRFVLYWSQMCIVLVAGVYCTSHMRVFYWSHCIVLVTYVYCTQAASPVHYTTSCKHSLVLLRISEIIARNLLLLYLVVWLYHFISDAGQKNIEVSDII